MTLCNAARGTTLCKTTEHNLCIEAEAFSQENECSEGGWLTNLTYLDTYPVPARYGCLPPRGDRRCGVGGRVEPEGGKGTPGPAILLHKPTPADLEVTQAAIPMRIDPASDIGLHYREADAGEVECRHGQHQKQPLQCLGRLQFARLDLKATGFIVQEGLFDVEPPAILG